MSSGVTNLDQMRRAARACQNQTTEADRNTAEAIREMTARLEKTITTDDVLSVTEILKIMEEQ